MKPLRVCFNNFCSLIVVVVGFVCVSRIGCCCCDCLVVVVTPLHFVLAPIKSFKPHGGCRRRRQGFNYGMVQHVNKVGASRNWCNWNRGSVGLKKVDNACCDLSQGLLVRESCPRWRSIQTPSLKKIDVSDKTVSSPVASFSADSQPTVVVILKVVVVLQGRRWYVDLLRVDSWSIHRNLDLYLRFLLNSNLFNLCLNSCILPLVLHEMGAYGLVQINMELFSHAHSIFCP
ncbi:transmembrane protein, putative [Medicago truncatula]|uniref:Transmembrane protein, putative n=1 Tax=Medicago truncatula TaxID=3880 RepID=G7KTY2_MEDTR|nr:transmembrane protein, putative [Medicago truncatula]